MENINYHNLLEYFGIASLGFFTLKLFGEVIFWYSYNRARGEITIENARIAATRSAAGTAQ
jgi:hypothetical protein